jgi:hypothetical protein
MWRGQTPVGGLLGIAQGDRREWHIQMLRLAGVEARQVNVKCRNGLWRLS